MIHKQLKVTTGETIDIYDSVFDADEMFKFDYFVENSLFHMRGTSLRTFESRKDFFLRSNFSKDDVKNFGIFESPNYKSLGLDLNYKDHWVTLSTHLSQYSYHPDCTDKGQRTLLYYVNTIWNKNWGGETFFCNKHGEVEIAVEFIPGRIVVFDNHLCHKPAPMSVYSSPFRHTFVAVSDNSK